MATFNTFVKGKNIMTPNQLELGETDSYYYELSGGNGISGNPIYGVTVVSKETNEIDHDISELFDSRRAAEARIQRLHMED